MSSFKFGPIPGQFFVAFFFAFLNSDTLHGQGQRIEVMDVDTGHHYTLDSNSPYDVQGSPTFSSNHEWVAFDGSRDGEPFQKKRLLVTKADGSQQMPTDLVCGAMPSFSEDGQRIAYSSPDRGGVWIMDFNGSNQRQVNPNGWSIQFSPQDKDLVAYSLFKNSKPNIELFNLRSGEKRMLLPPEVEKHYRQIVWNFHWSPDGSRIVFVGQTKGKSSEREVLVVASMGTGKDSKYEIVTVEKAWCRVLFHPLTNEVFYSKRVASKAGQRIFSVNLDAPKEFRTPVYFASQPDERSNKIGDFSSDGSLALLSSRSMLTKATVTSKQFSEKVRPILPAVSTLKQARSLLEQGDYEMFVSVLMGQQNDGQKKMLIQDAEDSREQLLSAINEALSMADKAVLSDNSIVFPAYEYSDGFLSSSRQNKLKMVREGERWRLDNKSDSVQDPLLQKSGLRLDRHSSIITLQENAELLKKVEILQMLVEQQQRVIQEFQRRLKRLENDKQSH